MLTRVRALLAADAAAGRFATAVGEAAEQRRRRQQRGELAPRQQPRSGQHESTDVR